MLHQKSFSELRNLYRDSSISPVDIAKSALEHAFEIQPILNAFAHLDPESTILAARESEERWRKREPLSALDGIPVTVKEFVNVKNWPTRRGSLTTSQEPVSKSAVFIERLLKAGAIILGKTRAPEFNWKGTTDSPGFGITRNPLDPQLTPGGSSGGCAAAVAAGVVRLSFGSDAGGSVRIPAAFCGILGLKPSLGKIPMTPFPSIFSELANTGPLGVDFSEIKDAMAIVSGPTPDDWTSWRTSNNFSSSSRIASKIIRIGVLNRRHWNKADPAIVSSIESFLNSLNQRNIEITEVDFDLDAATQSARNLYRLACSHLVSSCNEEQRSLMDPGLINWTQSMPEFSVSDYFAAMQQRAESSSSYNKLLQEVDGIILPTTPVRAFAAGRNSPDGFDENDWLSWNPYTPTFNLLQVPAVSIPIQPTDGKLPVGLQIAAGFNKDEELLKVANFLISQSKPLT